MEPSPTIPDELLQTWLQLLKNDKKAADDLYFAQLLPLVLNAVDRCEAHQAIRDRQTNILVSLMGFSPETTVISTHTVRPERLLIVLSGNAEASYDRAYDYLEKLVPRARIHQEYVDPVDPRDIYRKVQGFVARYGSQGRHVFDVTGGKKIMSATAGQVAWELDMPLCYVEGAYDPVIRRPRPGSEQVLLLENPSEQRQLYSRENALSIYRTGNFSRAAEAFQESSGLRTDDRLEELAIQLCRAYEAWSHLDLQQLAAALDQLKDDCRKPRIIEWLRQGRVDRRHLEEQLKALRGINHEPLVRMASYLELAAIYRNMRRHDFACLLMYRFMEALVDGELRRTGQGGFQPDNPQWDLLGDSRQLLADYAALSGKIDGAEAAEIRLPHKVGLVNGVALLCIVGRLHERQPHPTADYRFVQRIQAVARLRNQSVLAHGDRSLSAEDYDKMHTCAVELAQKILQEEFASLQDHQKWLQPINLPDR